MSADVTRRAAPQDSESAAAAGGNSGKPRRRGLLFRLLRALAVFTTLAILVAGGAAWVMYHKLDANIRTDKVTERELNEHQAERPQPIVRDAANILLIGTDDRSGDNSEYGHDSGSQRSDTTILLHLSADRSSATAVSIPRDLMVDIPSCKRPDGTTTNAQFAQFNWAFSFGGAACTIRTVEQLTDIRIDDYLSVDFTGFKKMVDAVGGVEVYLPKPAYAKKAHLDLPAGRQTLGGEDALAYVRAREGIGNGSDTERMGRQQQFLASLTKKVVSNQVLLNPTKLYPLLDAATSSLTASSGLDSLSELYDLARSLKDTPADQFGFLTVPRQSYAPDPNRDELVQPAADDLFTLLREDKAVPIRSSADCPTPGSTNPESPSASPSMSASPSASASASASASPSPYEGTTANHDICGY